MKLRLLNGAHSALAYLGYLAGHETIADAVADPVFRGYVAGLWGEIDPGRAGAAGGRSGGLHVRSCWRGFGNKAIRHRTWQIAMDGSQKLPQRLLATVRERLARGLAMPRLALGVAGWIRYVGGVDEAGRPIDVQDPLAGLLAGGAGSGRGARRRRVGAVLGVSDGLPRIVPAGSRRR